MKKEKQTEQNKMKRSSFSRLVVFLLLVVIVVFLNQVCQLRTDSSLQSWSKWQAMNITQYTSTVHAQHIKFNIDIWHKQFTHSTENEGKQSWLISNCIATHSCHNVHGAEISCALLP